MTAYRFVTLTCDECGEISDGGHDVTVTAARATARAEGWTYQQNRDLCPRHRGYRHVEGIGWVKDPQPETET